MRKLVTIRTVDRLIPINGCDNICLAVIDGWQVIVKKTEFVVGDSCLFFEIDSFIPVKDTRFQFLNKVTKFNGFEGYRIKTLKMRGVLSQGLALPLTMFPEIQNFFLEDYSEALGVVKYDNAVAEAKGGPKAGNSAGKFPSFIPKTDQERVQNLTSYFTTMKDEVFEETLKLDGSSLTCFTMPRPRTWFQKLLNKIGIRTEIKQEFRVCSRNLEIKEPQKEDEPKTYDNNGRPTTVKQSDYWTVVKKYNLHKKIPLGFAVQGEMIGPKIQANHEKVHDLEFYAFDVYDIGESKYLLPHERREFCATYDIPHVPVVSQGIKPFNMSLEELLTHVEGESMNAGTISEGRVYKHIYKDISFKVISNSYLLKSER